MQFPVSSITGAAQRRAERLAADAFDERGGDGSPWKDEFGNVVEAPAVPNGQKALPAPPTVLTIPEILAFKQDPNHYRLGDGLFGIGHSNSVIGRAAIGKSRLAWHVAYCHAAGLEKWFGLTFRGQGANWLFVDYENDQGRIQNDLKGFANSFSGAENAKVAEHLFWYLPLDDKASHGGLITNMLAKKRLIEAIKVKQPDFLSFDTLASCQSGLDLNTDQGMREAVDLLCNIRNDAAPQATLIILHHARSGAQNIKDALDNFSGGNFGKNSKLLNAHVRGEVIIFPGHADDDSKLVIKAGKVSNGKPFDPFGIRYTGETYVLDTDFDLDSFKDDVSGERTGNPCTIADIVAVVRSGVHKRKEIVQTLMDDGGASRATIDRRIKDALNKHYIETTQPIGCYVLGVKADIARKH